MYEDTLVLYAREVERLCIMQSVIDVEESIVQGGSLSSSSEIAEIIGSINASLPSSRHMYAVSFSCRASAAGLQLTLPHSLYPFFGIQAAVEDLSSYRPGIC